MNQTDLSASSTSSTSRPLVAVTGADGFIGSHLTEDLVRAGYRVRAMAIYNSQGSYGWLDTVSPEIMEHVEVQLGDVRDAVGALGGLLVGITSVGSGSLIMVALLLIYPTLSAVRLVGTDLVQAVPLVFAAAVGHVITEGIEWAVLIPLILGGTPGTFVGAKMARWVSQSVIRRSIVIVLTLTGLKLLGLPPEIVGIVGAGLLLLGPLAWGAIRQSRGLSAFDNNAAAWRHPERH